MDMPTDLLKMMELYLDECEQFLSGGRSSLPAHNHLLSGLPSVSFEATSAGDDEAGPFIAVQIRNHQAGRTALKFDPWYFAFLRVVEHSGALVRFHMNRRSDDPLRKDYLVISGATKAHGMVRVLRVIADAPLDMSVAQLPADYHEYRRALLGLVVRRRGTQPKSDRSTCLDLAVALFASSKHAKTFHNGSYRDLLERALMIADRMHKRINPSEGDAD